MILQLIKDIVNNLIVSVQNLRFFLLSDLHSNLLELVTKLIDEIHDDVPIIDATGCSIGGTQAHSVIGNDLGESRVDGDSAENVIVVQLFADAEFGQPVHERIIA